MYDRIITHNDMDGVVSAAICARVYRIGDVRFVGPMAIVKRDVTTTERDVVCDLPYPALCGLWFDHHQGNREDLEYRGVCVEDIPGRFAQKDSCGRVIYEYFQEREVSLPAFFNDMVAETDIIDSFGYRDLEDWRRETPGKLVDYSIKTRAPSARDKHQYMRRLTLWLRERSLAEVAALPEVTEKVARYKQEEERMVSVIGKDSYFLPYAERGEIVVIDVTAHARRPAINKNVAFLLYPEAMAVLEVYTIYDRGVKTTNFGLSMSLGLKAKENGGDKDLGEIMRLLNLGDGHKGAAAGRVSAGSRAEMVKKKEELLKEIGRLWSAQE